MKGVLAVDRTELVACETRVPFMAISHRDILIQHICGKKLLIAEKR